MATDNRKNFLNVLTRRGTDKSVPSYFYAPTKSLADSVFWPVAVYDPNVTVNLPKGSLQLSGLVPTFDNTSPLPVTFVNKTSGTSVVDGTTFATTAITTVTDKLYLMAVTVSSDQNATVSSISSAGGVSWTKVTNANPVNSGATQLSDIELWYGVCSAGASGVSWTITKSASTTNTADSYIIDEVSNAASTGVIVQSVIANNDSTSPVSGTLTAFSYSLNGVYSVGAVQAFTPSLTIEGGWTQLASVQVGGIPTITKTSYSTTQDTTPSYTFSGTIAAAAIIAVEIKSASATSNVSVNIPTGLLQLSGLVPTFNVTNPVTVNIPTGTLQLSGLVPTFNASDNKRVDLPVGTLQLSGLAPTFDVSNNKRVDLPVGTLQLTGLVPTFDVTTSSAGVTVDIPKGSLQLSGLAPTFDTSDNKRVDLPTGTLQLNGKIPTFDVSNNKRVDLPVGTLQLTGLVPTFITTNNIVVDLPKGSLQLAGLIPTFDLSDEVIQPVRAGGYSKRKKQNPALQKLLKQTLLDLGLVEEEDIEETQPVIEQFVEEIVYPKFGNKTIPKPERKEYSNILDEYIQNRFAEHQAFQQHVAERQLARKRRNNAIALLLLT